MSEGSRPDGAPVGSYQPSVLVVDVAMVLSQRGVPARLRAVDLPQAHQAAWTLLELFGVQPDTRHCPCLACGGAQWHLAAINMVAGDHPQLTGRPEDTTGDATGLEAPRSVEDRPPDSSAASE